MVTNLLLIDLRIESPCTPAGTDCKVASVATYAFLVSSISIKKDFRELFADVLKVGPASVLSSALALKSIFSPSLIKT